MKQLLKTAWICLALTAFTPHMLAQQNIRKPNKTWTVQSWKKLAHNQDNAFFRTEEARRVGNNILLFQRCTGGWPKNTDMAQQLNEKTRAKILKDKLRRDDSTIDNDATTTQLLYLARLYQQQPDEKYRTAFLQGIEYLLSGQYENGGWPQFWPNPRAYQIHITFNDGAMVNTLNLIRDVMEQKEPYRQGLTDKRLRSKLKEAFKKGINCILNTQIQQNGKLSIWCQQHDSQTLLPAPARAYELPSYCPSESAGIVRLLMKLPNPDDRVKKAIHCAMQWFDTYKLTGLRVEHKMLEDGAWDTRLVADSNSVPLWGRFYDMTYCEPYVCDRDGLPRRRLENIGSERRNGYSWYNSAPAELYDLYFAWADKYDPEHKINIRLNTPGANQNGRIQLYRKPVINRSEFEVVVHPGESIQKAIEKAPDCPTSPFKILLLKGEYNQKVIIDRPNIVLIGEHRDSTRITLAETAKTRAITEYHGRPVGNGVIVLQDNAHDCVISGLTVYNNYGTTIEKTTTHQMAIFGRATRTIIINCNVWADGNDALSLWAPQGNGMYYHADLYLRCPGVDFLCPRGWCYATRCRFYGDSRAMIWHDGRGDKKKKLVITDSYFDAKTPTLLGRYHHDSQFYLIKCRLSKNVLNANIHYAYSDKVLDSCPWGIRIYYYNCTREGGHSGWLRNNLQEADHAPEFYAITAKWTFEGKWDPEKKIRDLWSVLAY